MGGKIKTTPIYDHALNDEANNILQDLIPKMEYSE